MDLAVRRLPVYLLLDCSESMAGPGIDEVAQGVNRLITELRKNPHALESAYLSVITFSRTAKQVVPLTDIIDFQAPPLSVRTGTALGAALRVLMESIQRDVRRTTADTKGDYRPLVFLFTDGQPTDEWASYADQLKSKTKPRVANVYAFGCGPDVDVEALRRITDIVFLLKDLSHEGWQKVFVWMSASVGAVSQVLDGGGEGQAFNLPDLPAEALEVAPVSASVKDSIPRQVFLHARCSRGGQPYLMRFQRQDQTAKYVAVSAHPLDAVESDAASVLPTINSADLLGVPKCPYCGNQGAIVCECGTIICFSGSREELLTCPGCQRQGTPGGGSDSFNIRQTQG
jgi:uncharacterized protein YegL